MKKTLTILLAILVIGACTTNSANAQKKRSKRSRVKQTTATAKTAVKKQAECNVFPAGTWQTPLPGAGTLEFNFNPGKGTFSGRFFDKNETDGGGFIVTIDGGVSATGTYRYANNTIALNAKPANIIPKGTCTFSNYNIKGKDLEKKMSAVVQQKAEALVPLAKQLFNGTYEVSNINETSFLINIQGDVVTMNKVK